MPNARMLKIFLTQKKTMPHLVEKAFNSSPIRIFHQLHGLKLVASSGLFLQEPLAAAIRVAHTHRMDARDH